MSAKKVKVKIYLKAPISYYGGKQSLLSRILPLIPAHKKFVEPFLGGGAVYWSKEPSEIEVINDQNGFVTNFYEVAKTKYNQLERLINCQLMSRHSHDHAKVIMQNPELFNKVKKAWAFFYLANTSIYSILTNAQNAPGKDSKPVQTYHNKVERFTKVYEERLKNTYVDSRDALYVISRHDSAETFYFIDPPYYQADMGHYGGYTYEDFKALLELCEKLEGKFLLTCYPSELIDEFVVKNNWIIERHEMALSAGSKGKKKIEVFVRNYPLEGNKTV